MTWIVLTLTSAFLVAGRNVLTRKLSFSVGQETILFATFMVTACLSGVLLLITGIPELQPAYYSSILIAGFVDVFASGLLIWAISAAELGSTFPLVALTPIFLIGTSFLILGEVPDVGGVFGIIAIVIGAYLLRVERLKTGLLKPFKLLVTEKGPRYMLMCAVLFAFVGPFFKRAIINSTAYFTLATSQILSFFFILVILLIRRRFFAVLKEIRGKLLFIAVNGVVIFAHGLFLFPAFNMTLTAYVISIKRMSILFTILLGFIFLKEKQLLKRMIVGVIMVAGIFLIAV